MPTLIQIESMDQAQAFLGNGDEHIKYIEEELEVDILTRGQVFVVNV